MIISAEMKKKLRKLNAFLHKEKLNLVSEKIHLCIESRDRYHSQISMRGVHLDKDHHLNFWVDTNLKVEHQRFIVDDSSVGEDKDSSYTEEEG